LFYRLTRVNLQSEIHLSRDIHDGHVLTLAADAKANYLISSDKDLLVLKNIGKTKILTMTEFLDQIGQKGII